MAKDMQIGEILTSVQVPELIKDEFIRGGHIELSKRGLSIHFSGGFTVVFPCIVKGEKWAFRCWFNDLGNTRSRFQKLSDAMKNHPLKYLCEFHYVDEGIVVNGKTYPTTRMKWVDGMNIKDYVCKFRNNKKRLQALAEAFLQMCKDMHANHFSHGDLQHGNIIINEHGEIFLIDYDSLYHTSMGDMSDIIAGLKDYQHPLRRKNAKASEKVDYFSEVIIYTAILAVAEKPSLADTYCLEDAENMLFQASDYDDFINSNVYKDLSALNGFFPVLLEIIDRYLLNKQLDDLLPLENMLNAVMGEPRICFFDSEPKSNCYVGDNVLVKWKIEHAFEQELNGRKVALSTTSFETKLEKDTIFNLSISNGLKCASKVLPIKVYPLPKISFSSNKNQLRKGKHEEFTLQWDVKNAAEVLIYDSKGEVISEGKTGKITSLGERGTIFTLQAIGLDGRREFNKSVSLEEYDESIVDFRADKLFTMPGVPVHLSWDVKHAKKVELVGIGSVPCTGKHLIEPTNNTTVILRVTDKFGTTEHKQTITMLPLPRVQLKLKSPAYHTTVSAVQPRTFVNLFRTFMDLSVSLSKSSLASANCKRPDIEFVKSPQFVTPQFELKRKSTLQGFKDTINHISQSFINKLNQFNYHGK